MRFFYQLLPLNGWDVAALSVAAQRFGCCCIVVLAIPLLWQLMMLLVPSCGPVPLSNRPMRRRR
jgi:hypothetical protein